MEDVLRVLGKLDWSPLLISLKTGLVATFISFFLGVFAARKVVKASNRVKAIADGLLTLPMVLPPTVAGFFLLLLFSRRRPLGILLYEQFSIKVVQSWLGCIIAAAVIAFPLMYRNARAAFEQIDPNLVYAGRTLGMSEIRIFWMVVIPTAGPGIASGTILTFARALGEFGATSMLGGQHSRQDGHRLPEDRHGHSGRRLSDSRCMDCHRDPDRLCIYLFDESYLRESDEVSEAVVRTCHEIPRLHCVFIFAIAV